ncbi:MAG: hypothetical protein AB7F43_03050 [Bacteriovoracia bacterium]
MRYFIIFLSLLVPWNILAAETDQLTCRVKACGCEKSLLDLNDSVSIVDNWINDQIRFAVENSDSNTDIVSSIAWNLNGWFALFFPTVERWALFGSNRLDLFQLLFGTVYEDASFNEMKGGAYFPLYPTLKAKGILLGVDKVGHFFAQGWDYISHYREIKAQGVLTEEEALEEVKKAGVQSEEGYLGLTMGGIFSYADLSANWQGFQFYRDLTTGDNSFLQKDEAGKWKIRRPFKFEEYVVDNFDEVLTPNVFLRKSLTKKVHRKLTNHCHAYRQDPNTFLNLTGRWLDTKTYLPKEELLRKRFQNAKKHTMPEVCKN